MTARFAETLFRHRMALTLVFALITATAAVAATQARFTTGFGKLVPSNHAFTPAFERFGSIAADGGEILVAVTARDGLRLPDETVSTISVLLADVGLTPPGGPNLRKLAALPDGAGGAGGGLDDPVPEGEGDADLPEPIGEGDAALPEGIALSSADIAAGPSLNVHVQRGPEALFRVRVASAAGAGGLAELGTQARAAIEAAVGTEDYIVQTAALSYRIPWSAQDWGRIAAILAGGIGVLAVFTLIFTQSWLLGGLVLCLSLIAVIWQVGLIRLMGLSLHGLALPVLSMTLVLAVLMGVEQTGRLTRALRYGRGAEDAALAALKANLLPGAVGLLVAAGAFLACLVLPIPLITDIAITGAVGVGVLAFTHLLLLPVLAGQVGLGERFIHRANRIARFRERAAGPARLLGQTRTALMVVGLFLVIGNIAAFEGKERRIGLEPHAEPAGLHALIAPRGDFEQLAERFGTNPRSFVAYVDTPGPQCASEATDRTVAQFESYMKSLDYVRAVVSRGPLDAGDGCQVLAMEIVLRAWNSKIAKRLTDEIKSVRRDLGAQGEAIRLAGGPVALLAAVDDVTRSNELLMLLLPGLLGSIVFAALFRSWPAWLG